MGVGRNTNREGPHGAFDARGAVPLQDRQPLQRDTWHCDVIPGWTNDVIPGWTDDVIPGWTDDVVPGWTASEPVPRSAPSGAGGSRCRRGAMGRAVRREAERFRRVECAGGRAGSGRSR